jgi:hypothetical protein
MAAEVDRRWTRAGGQSSISTRQPGPVIELKATVVHTEPAPLSEAEASCVRERLNDRICGDGSKLLQRFANNGGRWTR